MCLFRCGRFGRRGTAISFIANAADNAILTDIERFYTGSVGMTTAWDASDIAGLSEAIKLLPEVFLVLTDFFMLSLMKAHKIIDYRVILSLLLSMAYIE